MHFLWGILEIDANSKVAVSVEVGEDRSSPRAIIFIALSCGKVTTVFVLHKPGRRTRGKDGFPFLPFMWVNFG